MKMGDGARADDGSISDVPWALVFDPAINVRALGEIQARGFRAAAALVDRFVQASATAVAEPVGEADRAAPTSPDAPPTRDTERLLQSWQGVLGQMAESLRGAVRPGPTSTTAVDIETRSVNGQLVLDAEIPGLATTEVWLHNAGPHVHGTLSLRCSDLLAHDGAVLSADQVSFDPLGFDMPARCSRGVVIEIRIADGIVPGRYHGTILVSGHPDIALPIVLTVTAPAS